jgi:hypothetical protein
MTEKPTLWIIGDSFSQPRKNFDTPLIWTEQVAALLSLDLGVNVELVNESNYGVSQDYCWFYLQVWLSEHRIKPQDYVIVVLTHPNRYWYIDQHPDLSNGHHILDLEDHITEDQSRAIELYMKEIQRPRLDTIQQMSRMGWLAYARVNHKLRRPLVIRAFEFDLYEAGGYPDLNISKGNLSSVQNAEFQGNQEQATSRYFQGTDPRYNHLCLSNHKILAGKVADALKNDRELDLTEGFISDIFQDGTMDDSEFCARELNPELYEFYLEKKAMGGYAKRNLTSWLKSVKIKQ